MSSFLKCIEARTIINAKCFKGGDPGHQKAIDDANNGFIRCQSIFFPKCQEPSKQKVPAPAPIPAPVPQENEDFMKKMEEITGLTGAALIIYLIISEGSRLFPPRNVIPVP
jgi:hypothetical protein